METLQQLLKFFKDRFIPAPITIEVDGLQYSLNQGANGPEIKALVVPPDAPTLKLSSVSGFVDAFNAGIDGFDAKAVAVHVIDHLTVALISLAADGFGRRHEWLRATCSEVNPFPFDKYVEPQDFLIKLQSGFLPTDDVITLQQLASVLTNESSIATLDDGLSQQVTVKQGAVVRGNVEIPKRIKLIAYRTFREIDPIASEFMVRLKGESGKLPQIALLQVDADTWKHDTQRLVAGWMSSHLPENTVVIA